jgi:hypothetical protein
MGGCSCQSKKYERLLLIARIGGGCCCHCKDWGRLLLSSKEHERLLLSLQGLGEAAAVSAKNMRVVAVTARIGGGCCFQSKEYKRLLLSLQGLGEAAAVRAKNMRGCCIYCKDWGMLLLSEQRI